MSIDDVDVSFPDAEQDPAEIFEEHLAHGWDPTNGWDPPPASTPIRTRPVVTFNPYRKTATCQSIKAATICSPKAPPPPNTPKPTASVHGAASADGGNPFQQFAHTEMERPDENSNFVMVVKAKKRWEAAKKSHGPLETVPRPVGVYETDCLKFKGDVPGSLTVNCRSYPPKVVSLMTVGIFKDGGSQQTVFASCERGWCMQPSHHFFVKNNNEKNEREKVLLLCSLSPLRNR